MPLPTARQVVWLATASYFALLVVLASHGPAWRWVMEAAKPTSQVRMPDPAAVVQWPAVLGAVTGSVALGLSLWNAWWAQRERLRVRLVIRKGLPSEGGMTGVYLLVANVSPFAVMVDAAGIDTVDVDGAVTRHHLRPPDGAGELPMLLQSHHALRFAFDVRTTVFASIDAIDRGYAITATGAVGRTPRWTLRGRRKLRELLPQE